MTRGLTRRTHLGNRSREDDHLVEFANSLHKLINTRSLDDVNIVIVSLNLDGDRKVGLVQNLRARENLFFGFVRQLYSSLLRQKTKE